MKNYMHGASPEVFSFLEAFSLENKGVTSFRLDAPSAMDIFTITVSFSMEVPEKPISDYFQFGLVPLDWTQYCIGCKHYGFGKHCKLIKGFIPESPYEFHCKGWEVTSRNMILYRRYTDVLEG